jgi:transketolase
MLEIGQKDDRLVVLLGDISHFIMQPFAKAFPERFYNVGICEPTIVSMAAGLSKIGLIPVVHTIAPFIIERSFEQIKLDFCYHKLSGNLITVGSAFDYSNLGCTHHCYDDFALMKSLPDTQVFYPASCSEFNQLFGQAYDNDYLKVYRIPEKQHGEDIDPFKIKIGEAIKIIDGKDLTIVSTGPQLRNAIDARRELSLKGWNAEILYVHTIHPLDTTLIRSSVEKTKRVLVVEEHNRFGGLANDILCNLYDIRDLQYSSIAIKSFIHDYGTYEEHCLNLGLSVEGIVNAVQRDMTK